MKKFLSPFAKYHNREIVDDSEEYFTYGARFLSRDAREGRRYPERKLEGDSLLLTLLTLFAFNYSLFARPVFAHCPLCVAGAAAGITLTRWIGVDDSITGVWIGALVGASSFWLLRALGQRNKIFFSRYISAFVYLFIFVATIWSFYKFSLVGKMGDIFGFDKLTFGMVLGALVFYLVDILNGFIKRKNGKSLFPYQSIVFSLGSMFLASIGLYILLNYYI